MLPRLLVERPAVPLGNAAQSQRHLTPGGVFQPHTAGKALQICKGFPPLPKGIRCAVSGKRLDQPPQKVQDLLGLSQVRHLVTGPLEPSEVLSDGTLPLINPPIDQLEAFPGVFVNYLGVRVLIEPLEELVVLRRLPGTVQDPSGVHAAEVLRQAGREDSQHLHLGQVPLHFCLILVILDRRFAKGEITKEVYAESKGLLLKK